MGTLLTLKGMLRKAYRSYDFIIRPAVKFLLSLIMLMLLQANAGYMEYLSSLKAILACSFVCMFLPWGGISFVCCTFLVADMFAVSYAMAGFAAVICLLVFVLYYGFRPGNGILMALVPLCFYLKVPFVIPLVLGMSLGVFSIIPAAFGVLLYYMGKYFTDNAAALSQVSDSEIVESFLAISKAVLFDKYMYVVIASFAICIIVVHVISHSPIDHAWTISVAAGTVIVGVFFIFADIKYGGSLLLDIAGLLLSFFIVMFYELIFYNLDYTRTEYLKFEDDDYYYYVKAVPKAKPSDEDAGRE